MDQRGGQNHSDGRGRSRRGGGIGRRSGQSEKGDRGGVAGRESLEEAEAKGETGAEFKAQGMPATASQPVPAQTALNATALAFHPRSRTSQAPLPPVRTYASVLESAAPEIGPKTVLTGPRSTQIESRITEPDETLETSQTTTQENVPIDLPTEELQPEPVKSSVEPFTPATNSEEGDAQDTSKSTSRVADAPSAITTAFINAPRPTSFLGLIAQTEAIRDAHARPAPELTNIGPDHHPGPTRAGFEATWAQGRVRSNAFPPSHTVLPTTAATLAAPPSPFIFSTPPPLPYTGRSPSSSATRGSRSRRRASSIVARRRIRRQRHSFSQPATSSFNGPRASGRRLSITPSKIPLINAQSSSPVSPLDRPGDTPQQKEKIRRAMSSFSEIGGTFDSIEWGQNQGQANHGESPEMLAVPAQPVATYTTVGSLRPATSQQFTAPNRIQRDGTGRRPPQPNLQGCVHDSQFGGRTMNQQYNLGHTSSTHPQYWGMNYSQYGSASQQQSGSSIQSPYGSMVQPQHDSTSQSRFGLTSQYGASSQPQYGVPNQSEHRAPSASSYDTTQQRQFRPLTQYRQENQNIYGSSSQTGFESIHSLQTRNISSSVGLTDDEKNILHASGLSEPVIGSSAPSMRSGNILQQNRDMVLRNDPSLNPQAESFNLQRQLRGHGSGQTKPTRNSRPEIETAQNHTQQMKPMQQLARDTLSESSGANTHHVAMSSGTHISQQSVMTGITSLGQTINDDNTHSNTGYDGQDRGDLDQNYRFPPPGLAHPTQGNRSDIDYGQQIASSFGSNEQVTTTQRYQDRSGRPQPLTAGPPGQRQNVSSAFPGIPSAQGIQVGASSFSSVQQLPVLPSNSTWLPNSRNNMFQSDPTEHSMVRDTLPPSAVRQFYPNGFANDMTGQYTRIPKAADEGMSREEIRAAKIDKSFYSGLLNINKTPNDHISEMAERNNRLDNGPNSQPPKPLDNNTLALRELIEASNPLTIAQIRAMNITEVSARLMGPVFGSTLRLADRRPGLNNLAMLARYAPAAPWAIGESLQGNQSFYGEDWGPTPRRVGRDPRYQPFQ